MNKKIIRWLKQIYGNIIANKNILVDIFLGRDSEGRAKRTSKTCYSLVEARKTLTLAKAEKLKGTAKAKVKAPLVSELMTNTGKYILNKKRNRQRHTATQ